MEAIYSCLCFLRVTGRWAALKHQSRLCACVCVCVHSSSSNIYWPHEPWLGVAGQYPSINPNLTEGIPLLTIYTSGNKLSKLKINTETVHLLADSNGSNKKRINPIKLPFLSDFKTRRHLCQVKVNQLKTVWPKYS